MDEEASSARAVRHPSVLLTVIGAYICFTLASSGAMILFEGLTTLDYGRLRGFGVVSFATRPVAFIAASMMFVTMTAITGWGMISLILRLLKRRKLS